MLKAELGVITAAIYGEQTRYKVTFDDGDTSAWMPATTSRADQSSPLQVGMQVLVLRLNDDSNIIIGAVHSDAFPASNDGIGSHSHFADGAIIAYDSSSSTLNIEIDGDAVINSSGSISLNGGAANMGVVTGQSICHFTGNPHADCSTKVLAGKN